MRLKGSFQRIVLFAVAAFIVFQCYAPGGVFAASATPKKGGTLTVALTFDLPGTDVHTGSSPANAIIMNHVYETLVGFGEKMEFVPILAERWEIAKDFKTYTFYLRKGKLFHNGREMVADDVKYSIERIMDQKTGCPRRMEFVNAIDTIEVKDKYTVVFHMKKQSAELLYLLSYIWPVMAIVPKEEIEKEGGVIKHPVGTGPYKFVEWKQGQHVLLEKFDQYKPQPGPQNGFGGERIAYVDKIKFVILPEDSARVMALLNKEIDVDRDFPATILDKFEQDYAKRGLSLEKLSGLFVQTFLFGCGNPVTNNPKFRQACAYATDLESLSQAAGFGRGSYSSFVVPSNPAWTPYQNTWYKKDVNKAKQLLQEAGYKGEPVVILTHKQPMYFYRLSVALQAELAAVGINAKLEVMEQPALVKKVYDRDFQIAAWMIFQADPVNNYAYFQHARFLEQAPRMKEIMDEAGKTFDVNVRKKLFEEAHKIMFEQVPAIPVNIVPTYKVTWNYVKGYKAHPTNTDRFWGVWLDK